MLERQFQAYAPFRNAKTWQTVAQGRTVLGLGHARNPQPNDREVPVYNAIWADAARAAIYAQRNVDRAATTATRDKQICGTIHARAK